MNTELRLTTDYNLFTFDVANRPTGDLRKLVASMKQYGFLPSHPLHVVDRDSKLVIIDGQNRFEAARFLSLPVYYVICDDVDISIPTINNAQRAWKLEDYVSSFAKQGNSDYVILLAFSTEHNIGTRAAASILSGQYSDSGHICKKIKNGAFRIKTRKQADVVVMIADQTAKHVSWSRHQGYLNALSRCLLVNEFDVNTYLRNISRRPYLLKTEHVGEDFLKMIENIMNYRASNKLPLAFLANEAARKHSAVKAA
jgi:hypothetical protein